MSDNNIVICPQQPWRLCWKHADRKKRKHDTIMVDSYIRQNKIWYFNYLGSIELFSFMLKIVNFSFKYLWVQHVLQKIQNHSFYVYYTAFIFMNFKCQLSPIVTCSSFWWIEFRIKFNRFLFISNYYMVYYILTYKLEGIELLLRVSI